MNELHPPENNGPFADDLDWTAFCYVAGELSADEAARFEDRLAGDQAAREAVARAVEVASAALQVAEQRMAVAALSSADVPAAAPADSHLPPRSRPRSVRLAAWGSLAAAAAITVVVWRLLPGQISQPTELARAVDPEALSEIVVTWSELQAEPEPWRLETPPEEELVPLAASVEPLEDPADEEALEIPEWLAAAIALPAPASVEEPAR